MPGGIETGLGGGLDNFELIRGTSPPVTGVSPSFPATPPGSLGASSATTSAFPEPSGGQESVPEVDWGGGTLEWGGWAGLGGGGRGFLNPEASIFRSGERTLNRNKGS